MVKRWILALICTGGLTGFGAPAVPENYRTWSLEPEWKIFFNDDFNPGDCVVAKYRDSMRLPDGTELEACRFSLDSDGRMDLNRVGGWGPPRAGRCALAVNRITLESPGRIQIGVGADWIFYAAIDGEIVANSRDHGGNGFSPASKEDHVIDVELTAGSHTLAFWLWSGSYSWLFACGQIPYRDCRIGIPQVERGPWLTWPVPTGITIGFCTDGPRPAGVKWRLLGSGDPWRYVWTEAAGQIDTRQTLHRIRLTGLKPASEYEYRIVMLTAADRKEVDSGRSFHFKTPAEKSGEFTFFVFGDMQHKPAGLRLEKVRNYIRHARPAEADFVVSLGDANSHFDRFEEQFFSGFVDELLAASDWSRPVIAVRGNHEYCGNESDWFADYFGLDGRTYGSFIYNGVCFVVLDTGNTVPPRSNTGHFSALDRPEEFMAGQKRFLKELVKSAGYRNARFRIALGHSAPDGHPAGYITEQTDQLIRILTEADPGVQLYLAGHIHNYRRTMPDKSGYWGFAPLRRSKLHWTPDFRAACVSVDGPGYGGLETAALRVGVRDGQIGVEAVDNDGRVFDRFTVAPDGSLLESKPGPELRFFENPADSESKVRADRGSERFQAPESGSSKSGVGK